MSFAALEYLPFLALTLALYTLAPSRAKAPCLLLASWVWYLWVEPRDGVWLAASTLVDYVVARRIHATKDEARRRAWLALSVAANLGLLATFKYAGLVVEALGAVSVALGGPALRFEGFGLPLGISFYTFQTLGYTIDVFRRRLTPATGFVPYALYVSFFPQLVAGPIERGGDLLPQLSRLSDPRVDDVLWGGRTLVWGLAKKWLVADPLRGLVWPVFHAPVGRDSLTLHAAALGMWVMLYLDFSAYTDLARGSARMFGVELVRNFDRPFLATSFRTWAGRWHMSLSNWMFDYVWGPLARGRPAPWRLWRANLCVMGLFGLWHGASATFLLWGLGYGVLLSIEQQRRMGAMARGERIERRPSRARALGGWLVTTFLGAQFIQLFFADDLAAFGAFQRAVWTGGLPPDVAAWRWVGQLSALYLALLALHSGFGLDDAFEQRWNRAPRVARGLVVVTALAVVATLRPAAPLDFVYFRF